MSVIMDEFLIPSFLNLNLKFFSAEKQWRKFRRKRRIALVIARARHRQCDRFLNVSWGFNCGHLWYTFRRCGRGWHRRKEFSSLNERCGKLTNAGPQNNGNRRRLWTSIAFAIGVLLLLGTWGVIFELESLFTESHLVGYYCCVTEADLPARGTLARTVSDFFRTFPGKHLPSLVFVAANLWYFVRTARRVPGKDSRWLPFLFVACGVVYLLADYWLVNVSWSISNRLVEAPMRAYKGFERTWYGIVLHLMLWVAYFAGLSGLVKRFRTKIAGSSG